MVSTTEQRAAHNAYMRVWKKRNPEKVNAINRAVKAKKPELYREINRLSMARARLSDPARFDAIRYRARERDPERYLWIHARQRAKQLGASFDLEVRDIEIPEFCPVLGLRLAWGVGKRASANRASPSLDRMDPAKGYVRGNVFVISNRANHLKNNATLAEIEAVAVYMRGHT